LFGEESESFVLAVADFVEVVAWVVLEDEVDCGGVLFVQFFDVDDMMRKGTYFAHLW